MQRRTPKRWTMGFGLLVSLATASCGGSSSAPSPTATGITITGADALRTGQTQSYSASLKFANGTTQTASANWTSDNSSVLTITSAGQATAGSQGAATLTASAQGVSATQTVAVWQDYQGTWTGTYVATRCTDSGALSGQFCPGLPLGVPLLIGMTLTQTGSGASGNLTLGSIFSTMSGTVAASRHFVGTASGSFPDSGLTLVFTVSPFDVLANGSTLTGSFTLTGSVAGFTGNISFQGIITSVTRINSTPSSLPSPAPMPGLSFVEALKRVR